jgi:hypothetical protein
MFVHRVSPNLVFFRIRLLGSFFAKTWSEESPNHHWQQKTEEEPRDSINRAKVPSKQPSKERATGKVEQNENSVYNRHNSLLVILRAGPRIHKIAEPRHEPALKGLARKKV